MQFTPQRPTPNSRKKWLPGQRHVVDRIRKEVADDHSIRQRNGQSPQKFRLAITKRLPRCLTYPRDENQVTTGVKINCLLLIAPRHATIINLFAKPPRPPPQQFKG